MLCDHSAAHEEVRSSGSTTRCRPHRCATSSSPLLPSSAPPPVPSPPSSLLCRLGHCEHTHRRNPDRLPHTHTTSCLYCSTRLIIYWGRGEYTPHQTSPSPRLPPPPRSQLTRGCLPDAPTPERTTHEALIPTPHPPSAPFTAAHTLSSAAHKQQHSSLPFINGVPHPAQGALSAVPWVRGV